MSSCINNSGHDADNNITAFDITRMRDLIDVLPHLEKKILFSMLQANHKDFNRIQTTISNFQSKEEKMKGYLKLLKEISLKLLEQQYMIYSKIFASFDTEKCKLIVKGSDMCKNNNSVSLTYGDIDFYSFNSLLQLAITSMKTNGYTSSCTNNQSGDKVINNGMVLVDLGHGTGRGVIAAALLYGQQQQQEKQQSNAVFRRIVGVEIIPELYEISKEAANTQSIQKYINESNLLMPYVIPNNEGQLNIDNDTSSSTICGISLSLGDFLSPTRQDGEYFDWTTADIVFANSTCFAYELLTQISNMAETMKVGSMFISLTNSLPSPYFRIIHEYTLPMSWGAATCYIHERLPSL